MRCIRKYTLNINTSMIWATDLDLHRTPKFLYSSRILFLFNKIRFQVFMGFRTLRFWSAVFLRLSMYFSGRKVHQWDINHWRLRGKGNIDASVSNLIGEKTKSRFWWKPLFDWMLLANQIGNLRTPISTAKTRYSCLASKSDTVLKDKT